MGLFDWFKGEAAKPFTGPLSPWVNTPTSMASLVISDTFGAIGPLPMTESEAMQAPAVSQGRNLIVSAIAQLPLRAINADGTLVNRQPAWTYRTNGTPPWHRMQGILDDLIFRGGSLLSVVRGADGYPLEIDRIDPSRWKVVPGENPGDDDRVLVDDKAVSDQAVIFIKGPHAGLLNLAHSHIRAARAMDIGWQNRVSQPMPLGELSATTPDIQLSDAEVKELTEAWAKARRNPDGTVGYTPYGISLIDHGGADAPLYIEGRNAVRNDIGSYFLLPPSLMGASLATSTLTYSTQEGQRNEFVDLTLPFWTQPIAERLSADDVVPSGQRIRFDTTQLTGLTPNPTASPVED